MTKIEHNRKIVKIAKKSPCMHITFLQALIWYIENVLVSNGNFYQFSIVMVRIRLILIFSLLSVYLRASKDVLDCVQLHHFRYFKHCTDTLNSLCFLYAAKSIQQQTFEQPLESMGSLRMFICIFNTETKQMFRSIPIT